jgi:LmeA-like phospholipid-binding
VPVRRAQRIAAATAGALLLLLLLAQLFLPGIAASRISDRVARYGRVRAVHVSAWPAVKLLWGDADSVSLRAGQLHLSPANAAKLAHEASGVARLDATATGVRLGSLQLSEVSMRKRGDELSARAFVSDSALHAALPSSVEELQLLRSQAGSVEVSASGGLFGISTSLDAVVQPREGRLVAIPRIFPLPGVTLTLFSDPHVYVGGVAASRATSPAGEPGYRLSMRARLH